MSLLDSPTIGLEDVGTAPPEDHASNVNQTVSRVVMKEGDGGRGG